MVGVEMQDSCSDSSVASPFRPHKSLAYRDRSNNNDGVDASRMEIMIYRINPFVFGATSWSFPAMGFCIQIVASGKAACGGDVRTSVSDVVAGEMMRL